MRVAIKTFGCRLNQAETAQFEQDFVAAGFQVVAFGDAVDVAVVHGCAVTRKAEKDALRVARGIKRAAHDAGAPEPFVVMVGCVVEANASRTEMDGVDLLVARADKARLVEIVLAQMGQPVAWHGAATAAKHFGRQRALVKVQDGCNFFCAYCIVPHTRGAPVSRTFDDVLAETRALAQAGVQEIVLAGCNVACYCDHGRGLVELVAAIAAQDEVRRIRLSSIEPATVEREIVDLMAKNQRICRYLHLPLQSGDVEMLRAMRRRYTPEAYAEVVRHAQRLMPDLGLGTDVITGFPGESDAAFANTRRMIEELPFNNLHVFPYSERPGTDAAKMGASVPPAVRKARANELIQIGVRKRQLFAESFVGRPVETLIEGGWKNGVGRGWTGAYLESCVTGVSQSAVGTIVRFTPQRVVDGVLQGAADS